MFSGSADGKVFITMLDTGLAEDSLTPEDQPVVLNGHKYCMVVEVISYLLEKLIVAGRKLILSRGICKF